MKKTKLNIRGDIQLDNKSQKITFEEGLEQLGELVNYLDSEDISVHEMTELFAKGKGLEKALREYLEKQQGRLEEIDEGNDIPTYEITGPSEPSADTS